MKIPQGFSRLMERQVVLQNSGKTNKINFLKDYFKRKNMNLIRNLMAVILFVATPLAYAGLDEGFNAYREGRHSDAMREYAPLAQKGNAIAQYWVGKMYHYGKGAPQDEVLALQWLSKSAEQGNVDGQYLLGQMYGNGKGAPRDLVMAYVFNSLAQAKGSALARLNLQNYETMMSATEIVQAKQLLRDIQRPGNFFPTLEKYQKKNR